MLVDKGFARVHVRGRAHLADEKQIIPLVCGLNSVPLQICTVCSDDERTDLTQFNVFRQIVTIDCGHERKQGELMQTLLLIASNPTAFYSIDDFQQALAATYGSNALVIQ